MQLISKFQCLQLRKVLKRFKVLKAPERLSAIMVETKVLILSQPENCAVVSPDFQLKL